MGFIRSKKIYAILSNDDEGREIIRQAPKLEQKKLDRLVDDFFNRSGSKTTETTPQAKEEDINETEKTEQIKEEEKEETKNKDLSNEKTKGGKGGKLGWRTAIFLVGDFTQIPIIKDYSLTQQGKDFLQIDDNATEDEILAKLKDKGA